MNINSLYLLIYFGLWLSYYNYSKGKSSALSCESAHALLYLVCAFFSVIYYHNSYYSGREALGLGPFLYLFIFIIVTLIPLSKFSRDIKIKRVKFPPRKVMNLVCVLIIANSVLVTPEVYRGFDQGILSLLKSDDAGRDLYEESLSNYEYGVGSVFLKLLVVLSPITVLLLLCLPIRREKNKLITIGLIHAFILALIQPISMGNRTMTTLTALTAVMTFFSLKRFYLKKTYKIIRSIGIFIFLIILIPFISLTFSRYNDSDGGVIFSVLRYTGEANVNFNQYCLGEEKSRKGDKVLTLPKRVLGADNATLNYIEMRFKYANFKIDDSTFYTFVGDLVLDFNPYGALLICIICSLLITWATTRKRGETDLEFSKIVLLFFVICVCTQGAFYLYSFGYKSGNYKLIVLIITYILAKVFEHESKSNSILSTTVSPNTRK